MFATACAGTESARVVLIPPTIYAADGTPSDLLRLAEPVEARVLYAMPDGTWRASANKVTLPEGWIVVAPPPAEGDR